MTCSAVCYWKRSRMFRCRAVTTVTSPFAAMSGLPDCTMFDCAGYITVPATADYTFSMDNDDGAMLFIDGHSLVNHTGARDHAVLVPLKRPTCWRMWSMTLARRPASVYSGCRSP